MLISLNKKLIRKQIVLCRYEYITAVQLRCQERRDSTCRSAQLSDIVLLTFQSLYDILAKLSVDDTVQASSKNSEPGVIPGRYRHCKRGETASLKNSHWMIIPRRHAVLQMRKPGDLLSKKRRACKYKAVLFLLCKNGHSCFV